MDLHPSHAQNPDSIFQFNLSLFGKRFVTIYGAIHKAAVQHSAGGWNDLRDHLQPPTPFTASGTEWWNDGMVPGKIMERPATVRSVAL